ncbi:putative helicase mov-10-B.2 [Silurus meridionalis]|nr:putative helicase mov-10-B.2 [Silurus meridionalis]
MVGGVDTEDSGKAEADCHKVEDLGYRKRSNNARGQLPACDLQGQVLSIEQDPLPGRNFPRRFLKEGQQVREPSLPGQQGATRRRRSCRRRRRGGRSLQRQQGKEKWRRVEDRVGTLNVGTMTVKGRELADMMERRKVDMLCVQETKWKGSKAMNIGGGVKLLFHSVDGKKWCRVDPEESTIRAIGLDFIEFLHETQKFSVTQRDELQHIYNTEFRNRHGGRDPNFSSLLFVLRKNNRVRVTRSRHVYFNANSVIPTTHFTAVTLSSYMSCITLTYFSDTPDYNVKRHKLNLHRSSTHVHIMHSR